jgi:hypothetical protein
MLNPLMKLTWGDPEEKRGKAEFCMETSPTTWSARKAPGVGVFLAAATSCKKRPAFVWHLLRCGGARQRNAPQSIAWRPVATTKHLTTPCDSKLTLSPCACNVCERSGYPDATMQLPARHLIALSALLAYTPTLSTVWAAGIQPAWYHREAHRERGDGYVPFLKRLRDSAVELILGPPPSSRAKPVWTDAASVHARYRDDVVIRFNVTNPEEETALSVAAVQLILDLWAFTPDYVDVRISKRYLPGLLKLLPNSLQHTVLISDVAAAAWATFPSTDAPLSNFDTMSTPAKRNMLVGGADNIFFSDYQPLIVGFPTPFPSSG